MLLNSVDIRKICFGAIRVFENEGAVCFERFEGDPIKFYGSSGKSTASVMLDFYTDARSLSFDYKNIRSVGRHHAFYDLYENEVLIAHFGNAAEEDTSEIVGSFNTELSAGVKRLRLYLPNLFETRISNLSLDGASYVEPVKKEKKLLMMGDSITHGYDAYFPSLSYANTVAREFNFDMINQAIGGAMFRTESLPETSTLTPDYITVAYGTNDWSWSQKSLSECIDCADAYFKKLRVLYRDARIFYITPLYRGDESRITSVGDFHGASSAFAEVAKRYGAEIIDGRTMIPHHTLMFDDKYLHPNDLGFTQYANALIKKLKELGVK